MNLAGVRRLPVVFIIDNNQWAYSTPSHLEYAVDHLADRAAGYGFDGVVVDGTDVLAVYREAKQAIEKARDGGGPTLIESVTLRMEGHAVHDDAFYPQGAVRGGGGVDRSSASDLAARQRRDDGR
jgi:TPP-dependent pyruvate/acetoin dehydrogenase alpha subunit